MILFLLLHNITIAFNLLRYKKRYFKRSIQTIVSHIDDPVIIRSRKKPQWVVDEVIKIKALMPTASCRIISLIFNQRHQQKETIGKTFVDYTIRKHLYEIQSERRKIKSKPAYKIPFNKVWGMDITLFKKSLSSVLLNTIQEKA